MNNYIECIKIIRSNNWLHVTIIRDSSDQNFEFLNQGAQIGNEVQPIIHRVMILIKHKDLITLESLLNFQDPRPDSGTAIHRNGSWLVIDQKGRFEWGYRHFRKKNVRIGKNSKNTGSFSLWSNQKKIDPEFWVFGLLYAH